jgi:hypothetical protein
MSPPRSPRSRWRLHCPDLAPEDSQAQRHHHPAESSSRREEPLGRRPPALRQRPRACWTDLPFQPQLRQPRQGDSAALQRGPRRPAPVSRRWPNPPLPRASLRRSPGKPCGWPRGWRRSMPSARSPQGSTPDHCPAWAARLLSRRHRSRCCTHSSGELTQAGPSTRHCAMPWRDAVKTSTCESAAPEACAHSTECSGAIGRVLAQAVNLQFHPASSPVHGCASADVCSQTRRTIHCRQP